MKRNSYTVCVSCETFLVIKVLMESKIREFCETTTFDGFPHWYNNKSFGWKIVWSIVILLAFCVAGVEIWKVFDDYRNKPISTYYQIIQTNNGVDFPDVVLCNTNAVNSSKIKESNLSVGIINAILLMYINDNRIEVTRTFFQASNFLFDHQLDDKLSALNDSSIAAILKSISYDQQKFIRSCFYQKDLCHLRNISVSHVRDSEYGICFHISVNLPQYMPRNGLTLILDVHSELWWTSMPAFTSGVSLKLEREYDQFSVKHLHLSSGSSSQILLNLMHHKKYDDGKNISCRNDMDRYILKGKYTVDLCRAECFLKNAYKNCACVPSVPRDDLLNKRIPYCITTKQQNCIQNLLGSTDKRSVLVNCSRRCIPKCDYWSYSSTVSSKKFPANGVRPILTRLNNVSMDENRLDDYMLIDISLEQIQYTEVLEQESLTIDGFIGQIGGHLGLFLGAGIMSVVHILILALQTICTPLISKSKS